MQSMQSRDMDTIDTKLEAAMARLRVIRAEGISMSVYAAVLDARMDLAHAQGALMALRRDLEGRR